MSHDHRRADDPEIAAIDHQLEEAYARRLETIDLIDRLSLARIALHVRARNPRIRTIVVDWEDDGLIPVKAFDDSGHDVGTDDVIDAAPWPLNLTHTERLGLVGDPNGPFTIDLSQIPPLSPETTPTARHTTS